MKIIQTNPNQRIVREKITFYRISQDDPKSIIIWLDGGGIINTKYPDAETAKARLDELDKLMTED